MKQAFLAFAMLLLAGTSFAQTFSYSNTSCSGVWIILYADNGAGGCGGPVAQSFPFLVPAGPMLAQACRLALWAACLCHSHPV